MFPAVLDRRARNPAAGILAFDDEYSAAGNDQVIDMHRAAAQRQQEVIENRVAAFLQPRSQDSPHARFGHVAPVAGRRQKNNQQYEWGNPD